MDQLSLLLGLLVGILVILLGSMSTRLTRTRARLTALESTVDRLVNHLGIHDEAASGAGLSVRELDRVVERLNRGKKMEAIKVYRDITSAGLKSAKETVERLEASR